MIKLKEKLQLLYPEAVQDIYPKLLKLIDEFKNNYPQISKPTKGSFFSEKDIVLICYADHVKEEGEKTFRTMQKFLFEYAKGVINKIHFLPFYSCSDIDDGFSVLDYYRVKEQYGDWDDLKKIGENFGFMFDLVLNHASVQSEMFKGQIAGKEKFRNWFLVLDKPIDVTKVFRPRTHPLLTPVETSEGKKYAWTTFSEDQVDWNFKNPEVLLEMIRILLHYLENGAEAVRLDAVAYAWKELDAPCFDLPECHTLVQIFRDVFREVAPRAWVIAETVLPHESNIKYLGDGHNESHFVYNFALETLLLHTFVSEDSRVATQWLNRLDQDFNADTSILNLSVSHDGVHVIPAKGLLDEKQMMAIAKDSEKKGGQVLYRTVTGKHGKVEPYELNITYPSAIGGVEKYLASQAIQLALKGVPLIYFNNLIGAENWTKGVEKLGYSRAINREKFDYLSLINELKDPTSKKYRIYEGYLKLIKARVNEPLFSPLAKQKMLDIDKHIVAIKRFNDKDNLIALANISSNKIKLKTALIKKHLQNEKIIDIITARKHKLNTILELKPYQTLWLK